MYTGAVEYDMIHYCAAKKIQIDWEWPQNIC